MAIHYIGRSPRRRPRHTLSPDYYAFYDIFMRRLPLAMTLKPRRFASARYFHGIYARSMPRLVRTHALILAGIYDTRHAWRQARVSIYFVPLGLLPAAISGISLIRCSRYTAQHDGVRRLPPCREPFLAIAAYACVISLTHVRAGVNRLKAGAKSASRTHKPSASQNTKT